MLVHPQRSPRTARLGVTVSRHVGGAVVRNRIKRRVREIFRLHPAWFSTGLDYVLVARPGARTLDYGGLTDEIQRLCKRGSR